jgi:hypothetical protein
VILLVSGATAIIRRYPHLTRIGHLLTPRNGNRVETLLATGRPIAADNDCYQRLDRAAYLRMLRRIRPFADRVLWVTAPDVVADAAATLARWRLWHPVLRYLGLRTAYVAQDGSEVLPPPWNELDALFIGGSTTWKEGEHARTLIREAKARSVWVHVGRVNTLRRVALFSPLDVDSIDGTAFSRFSDKYIPWIAPHLAVKQHAMEDLYAA